MNKLIERSEKMKNSVCLRVANFNETRKILGSCFDKRFEKKIISDMTSNQHCVVLNRAGGRPFSLKNLTLSSPRSANGLKTIQAQKIRFYKTRLENMFTSIRHCISFQELGH